MKTRDAGHFMKLFSLYLDGVLSQYEFLDMISELMDQNTEVQLDSLRNIVSLRDTNRREGIALLKPISEMDKS